MNCLNRSLDTKNHTIKIRAVYNFSMYLIIKTQIIKQQNSRLFWTLSIFCLCKNYKCKIFIPLKALAAIMVSTTSVQYGMCVPSSCSEDDMYFSNKVSILPNLFWNCFQIQYVLEHRFLTWGPWRGSRGSTKITKVRYCTL